MSASGILLRLISVFSCIDSWKLLHLELLTWSCPLLTWSVSSPIHCIGADTCHGEKKISLAAYIHPNKALIKGHNSFKNQFLYYLSTAQNISSFRYYFKVRTGVNEETVKLEFQAFFRKYATDIWADQRINKQALLGTTNLAVFSAQIQAGQRITFPFYNFINIFP